jgi:hypothetical protein
MHNNRVAERHVACDSVECTHHERFANRARVTCETFRQNYSEVVTIIELMNRGIEGALFDLQR